MMAVSFVLGTTPPTQLLPTSHLPPLDAVVVSQVMTDRSVRSSNGSIQSIAFEIRLRCTGCRCCNGAKSIHPRRGRRYIGVTRFREMSANFDRNWDFPGADNATTVRSTLISPNPANPLVF